MISNRTSNPRFSVGISTRFGWFSWLLRCRSILLNLTIESHFQSIEYRLKFIVLSSNLNPLSPLHNPSKYWYFSLKLKHWPISSKFNIIYRMLRVSNFHQTPKILTNFFFWNWLTHLEKRGRMKEANLC